MKKLISLILVLALALTAFTVANAEVDPDRVIVVVQGTDVQSLDPALQNDTYSKYVIRSMYETLVEKSNDGEFIPGLAESWEYAEDAMSITFHLRDNVYFHHGEKLKAEDVGFTWDRAVAGGKIAGIVECYDHCEVIDEFTVKMCFNQPIVTMLSNVASLSLCIVSKEYTEALEAEGKSLEEYPNGTGPYSFVSYTPMSEAVVTRFDGYWDQANKAKNGGIIFRIIPEEVSRTIALETGEVDMLLDVPTTDAQTLMANPDLQVFSYSTGHMEFIIFNQNKEIFKDKRVRQAISYALDRDAWVYMVYSGNASPNYTYVGLASPGFSDNVTHYEFDLEKAKALLEEAGVTNLTFVGSCSTDARERGLVTLQANLAEIGVTMEISHNTTAAFLEGVRNHEHDICVYGYIVSDEPDSVFTSLLPSTASETGNIAGFCNEEVDELVKQAKMTVDQTERYAIYEKIQQICAEEAVWIPCASRTTMVAAKANLTGFEPSNRDNHILTFVEIDE